ncbi:MAG: hypothetical protein VSS75_030825 [Candidatus Parabeggiatoa sp.]|nr:hypothetical protein [Candidatus Parabeggiatoa sp.]
MERIYRELENGEIVKGIGLPAFIHNMSYHCVLINIYQDGVIDCWEEVDFEGFVEKVKCGWIVTQLPKGGEISLHHSFDGKTDQLETYVKEEEFVKEVKDTLDELNGKPTSSDRCYKAFIAYLSEPTERAKKLLEKEYRSIPEHLKRYVLHDMDFKDGPIRYILSNEIQDEKRFNYWRERYGKH